MSTRQASPTRSVVVEIGKDAESEPAAAPPSDRDRELVSRLLGGDEAAFVSLVQANHGAMLRIARLIVSSQAVAEEVVQETWTAAIEGLARFEQRSSLRTWLFRILVNRARTRATREARTVPLSFLSDQDQEDVPAVDPERFNRLGFWRSTPSEWDAHPEPIGAEADA